MNEAEARQLLAVRKTASRQELKTAYRRTQKTWHPDLFQPNSPSQLEAISKTQRINEAYRLLRGEDGRQWDGALEHPVTAYYQRSARNEAIFIWCAVVLSVVVVIIVEVFR